MSYQLPKNRTQLHDTAMGLITQNLEAGTFTSTTVLTTQRIQAGLVGLLQGDVVTNIHVGVSTIPSGASSSAWVAIYNITGTRLAVSNDLTTSLDTTGVKTLALSAAYTVPQDGAYYLALLVINTNTPPAILRSSVLATFVAGGTVGSGVSDQVQQASQTSMPAQATFVATTLGMWWGCS